MEHRNEGDMGSLASAPGAHNSLLQTDVHDEPDFPDMIDFGEKEEEALMDRQPLDGALRNRSAHAPFDPTRNDAEQQPA